jgi:hypothetical protein
MIELAGLYFMEGNDDILEKDYMFFSERHCKSTDDTG